MAVPVSTALSRAFPTGIPIPVAVIAATLSTEYQNALSPDCFPALVAGETLHIPARIHFAQKSWRPMLHGSIEEQVQQCLFTRSYDGYIRQRALRQILPVKQPWVMPYIVALVGEYVLEILDDILTALPQIDQSTLRDFLVANPATLRLVRARVESYFGCYFRRQFTRDEYCGFALIAAFDALIANPEMQKSPA
jgi:hypothetical protein